MLAAGKFGRTLRACQAKDVQWPPQKDAMRMKLRVWTEKASALFEKKDRALRAKLLRAAAGRWGKDAAAYARDAFKPSPEKLAKKLGRSRFRLEAQVGKAIMAATKKGIVYTGPDGPALADAVRTTVEDFLVLTGGTPASN